jgi:uncharacterized membrane protein
MIPSVYPSEPGNIELVQRATSDAKELIRLEIALAKNELNQEIATVKSSAILGALALVCGLTGIASLAAALGLVMGPLAGVALGILLLGCAALLGFFGYRRFPKEVMAATGLRIKDDEAVLKEHLS